MTAPPAPTLRPLTTGSTRAALAAEEPGVVVHVEPGNGATGILRDSPVVTRLSQRVDLLSLTAATFRVEDASGPVPARLAISPDGHVVLWWPERLLEAGAEHRVVAEGLRDAVGRPIATWESRFVAGGFAGSDLSE
jgi:hypothetical protein